LSHRAQVGQAAAIALLLVARLHRSIEHDRRRRRHRAGPAHANEDRPMAHHQRHVNAAFNQGDVPRIACFNRALTPLGVDLHHLVEALNRYVSDFVAPVWGTPAELFESQGFVAGCWAIVFLDDADQPGALAYHELTPDGLPLSKVFVKTTLAAGEAVSVSTSHELAEMLVDPAINLMTTGPDPRSMYAYESADPVEALSFDVDGIAMSDFVYPSYFEGFRKPRSVKFDHMGAVERPFQILPGGYQILFRDGTWTHEFGSRLKARQFAREDRDGHRGESRMLGRLEVADGDPAARYTAGPRRNVA